MQTHERETYRLHAKLPVHARRIERAKRIVREAMDRVPGIWGVGLSGGKDSIVLAHICCEAGWDGPLFHYYTAEIPEENTMMALAVGRRLNREVITEEIEGDWALWEKAGRAFFEPETDLERKLMSGQSARYKRQIADAVAAHGLVGLFWGLRKDESRARRITISKYGTIYKAASRNEWTAHPLSDWTGRDVWAYLVAHDLPWLERYDLAEDRERERSETTFIFGRGGDGLWAMGQGQRLRESDPALWARLCQRWPDLRKYG